LPGTYKFAYLDDRVEFFQVLGEELSGEVELLPYVPGHEHDLDGLIVGVSGVSSETVPSFLANLSKIVLNPAGLPVIAFVPSSDRHLILQCLSTGAYDYFVASAPLDELRIVLRRAAQYYELYQEVMRFRRTAPTARSFEEMIGTHESMLTVFRLASKVADTDATLLITGESGTGKELLARCIHQASSRARHPFVAVSCAAFPETLIEAELFGHEKGAFTGAITTRRGRFEIADNGTIFLDEIGELPPTVQTKLLRVLQERTFERLGSNVTRPVLARIICATNKDLKKCVQEESFRLDLYYRLNTIEISIPALRDRWDDVVLLAQTFLKTYAEHHKRPAQRFSPAVLSALRQHQWPGNVRELQHVVERAVVICDGPEIRTEHLPSDFEGYVQDYSEHSFDEEVRSFKRRLIQRALLEYGYNKLQAARSLKMPRTSLHRLIGDLRIPDKNSLS
jgi:DNA-binding NtrC family response regulator